MVSYKDMSPEQKAQHYARTERWRKKNTDKSNLAANKYYHANKEVCAIRAKAWRDANKDYILLKQRTDKRNRKLWAIEYLGGTCSQCGEKHHPAVYEFHHTDPATKDRDPSKMLQLSLTKLIAELDKCILVCANCHRYIHHGDKY